MNYPIYIRAVKPDGQVWGRLHILRRSLVFRLYSTNTADSNDFNEFGEPVGRSAGRSVDKLAGKLCTKQFDYVINSTPSSGINACSVQVSFALRVVHK